MYVRMYTTCDYKMCQVPLWFLLRCGSGRASLSCRQLGRFSSPVVRDRLKRVAYWSPAMLEKKATLTLFFSYDLQVRWQDRTQTGIRVGGDNCNCSNHRTQLNFTNNGGDYSNPATRILLILELLSACALCWGAAVFAEHELSLQHLAVRGSALADSRLCRWWRG